MFHQHTVKSLVTSRTKTASSLGKGFRWYLPFCPEAEEHLAGLLVVPAIVIETSAKNTQKQTHGVNVWVTGTILSYHTILQMHVTKSHLTVLSSKCLSQKLWYTPCYDHYKQLGSNIKILLFKPWGYTDSDDQNVQQYITSQWMKAWIDGLWSMTNKTKLMGGG